MHEIDLILQGRFETEPRRHPRLNRPWKARLARDVWLLQLHSVMQCAALALHDRFIIRWKLKVYRPFRLQTLQLANQGGSVPKMVKTHA
jgi:hypothetical protein